MKVFGCFDCRKNTCANYMVEPSVWRQAFPNYAEVKSCNRDLFVELCFDCLSRRLGRSLTLNDFSDAPVNEGVRLGYRLSLQGGGITSESVEESIHGYFELNYSSYLVLPRSILQSAPTWWQSAFVFLLRKLEEWFDCPVGDYWVRARRGSKFTHDPLADYDRGRRKILMKSANPTTVQCLGEGPGVGETSLRVAGVRRPGS